MLLTINHTSIKLLDKKGLAKQITIYNKISETL